MQGHIDHITEHDHHYKQRHRQSFLFDGDWEVHGLSALGSSRLDGNGIVILHKVQECFIVQMTATEWWFMLFCSLFLKVCIILTMQPECYTKMTAFPAPLYAVAEFAVPLQNKLCLSGVVNWQSEMNVMRNTYIVQNNTKTTVTLFYSVLCYTCSSYSNNCKLCIQQPLTKS